MKEDEPVDESRIFIKLQSLSGQKDARELIGLDGVGSPLL